MDITIRKAEKKDMPDVLCLIQELASFENEPDAVKISAEVLEEYGTGESPLFTCFLAETSEEVVGMALVYFRFSTWAGKSLHLEDLIVSQKHRNKGYGKALYTKVMQYAKEQKVKRVEWVVLDWNTNAIEFYERSGALLLKDWFLTQMDEEGLNNYLKTIK